MFFKTKLKHWWKKPFKPFLFNFKLNSKCCLNNGCTSLKPGLNCGGKLQAFDLAMFSTQKNLSKNSKIGFAETFDSYAYRIIDWCSSLFRRKVWKKYENITAPKSFICKILFMLPQWIMVFKSLRIRVNLWWMVRQILITEKVRLYKFMFKRFLKNYRMN